jgi:hypothetical protein
VPAKSGGIVGLFPTGYVFSDRAAPGLSLAALEVFSQRRGEARPRLRLVPACPGSLFGALAHAKWLRQFMRYGKDRSACGHFRMQ